MKKILSFCVAAILAITMFTVPAYAAAGLEKSPSSDASGSAESNEKIAAAAKALESIYGISIKYPKKQGGDAIISMNNIETLDRALSTMTPEAVKQISNYYEKKNGKKIEIEYYFSNSDYSYNGGVLMAAFEPGTSKIFIFLPAKAGRAIISGENPIALVHEMGHAFHLMCMDLYGDQKMKDEWIKFNSNSEYDSQGLDKSFDKDIFVSAYATTKYEEDFAETFGHAFARTSNGTGFRSQLSKDSKPTGLGQKVNYIEKLINTYIKKPDKTVENLRKIYKTTTSLKFEGITFRGETLQYIGYPQPRNILKGILGSLDIQSQKSTWVRSLGAWRVIDTEGDMFFIFPGGSWMRASEKQQAA